MLDYLLLRDKKKNHIKPIIKLITWGPHKINWGPHLGSRPQVWEPLVYSMMLLLSPANRQTLMMPQARRGGSTSKPFSLVAGRGYFLVHTLHYFQLFASLLITQHAKKRKALLWRGYSTRVSGSESVFPFCLDNL